MSNTERIGEVVESNTNEFVTQCYDLYTSPPIGTLIRVGETETVYGLVSYSSTAGLDPTRKPIPRGKGLGNEDEIYRENPQLDRLLNTEFKALSVGYKTDNSINLYTSPVPPRIHSFVSVCGTDEINIFANSMRFLDVVLRSPVPQADDVVAGFIRFASDTFLGNENIKLEAARVLANMLSNDTRRLDGIIRRIR